MYGSGGRREEAYEPSHRGGHDEAVYHEEEEDYGGQAPAPATYVDIPSTEELEAMKEASQYTDSLTPEQKEVKMREGIQMAALLVLGLLGLGVMLVYLDFVLVPLVFSRFLIYIFQPFINVLVGKKPLPLCKVRFRWPRWVAVVTVLFLLAVVFAALGLIVTLTISDIIDNADYYKERVNNLMDTLVELGESYGYTREDVEAMVPEIDLAAYAVSAASYLANIVTQMVLVMLIVVYMLLGYDGSNKSVLQSNIDSRIRKYIMIHSFISVLTGVGTSIILLIFGVDLVLFLGLMACILNYIPNIGSVLGVLLPLPFVLFKEEFALWELLAVAVALTVMQFLTGQVLEPKILGNAMDMPPITVICALLFWGALWGIIGAILSVPLTVAVQLYLENIDHPAAKALAGMIVGDFKMFDTSKPRDAAKEEAAKKKDLELGVLSDDVAPAAPHHDDYHHGYEAERPRGKGDADYYGGGGDEYYGRGGAGYDEHAYRGGEDYRQPEQRQSRRSKP